MVWKHCSPLDLSSIIHMIPCPLHVSSLLSLCHCTFPWAVEPSTSEDNAHFHYEDPTLSGTIEISTCGFFVRTVKSTVDVCHTGSLLAKDQTMGKCPCRRVQILSMASKLTVLRYVDITVADMKVVARQHSSGHKKVASFSDRCTTACTWSVNKPSTQAYQNTRSIH